VLNELCAICATRLTAVELGVRVNAKGDCILAFDVLGSIGSVSSASIKTLFGSARVF
jgi:hypothetical protein